MLHMLSLDQLRLSAHNVRKTAADAGLDELTASLAHHGLQHSCHSGTLCRHRRWALRR
jgi:ParB-like chromosome segregation protein Spo0J